MTAAADSAATGRTRALVAAFVRRHPGSTPRQIADGAGLSRDVARKTAARMTAAGELTIAGQRGHYFWVPPHRRRLAVVPDVVREDTTPEKTTEPDVPAAVPAEWRCPHCAGPVGAEVQVCPACGWPRGREVPR